MKKIIYKIFTINSLYGLLLIFAISLSTDVHAQSIPELMYFKFNSVTGSDVANEAQTATRVSTNGTLNGTTIGGAGQFGTALLGNGGTTASNSLNANWATNLSGSWTISLWMKGITNTATSNYIFGGSGGSTFRAFTGTGLVSGGGNIMVRGTGMTDVLINNIFDASGSAVVVHIVYDNTTPAIRAYKNGALVLTVAQTSTMTLTGTDFRVGGQATSNGIPNGSFVDEFRMYNRALTAAEIASTWNIELNPGPPCPGPTNITINNVNSTSVDFSWTGVGTSIGYEYIVDQNATGPTVTPSATGGLSASAIGLTPATQYYIHVRNKCAANSLSSWVTLPFMTNPPCTVPPGFIFNYIGSDSVSFSWGQVGTSVAYEYRVDQVAGDPAPGSVVTYTPNTFGNATGLTEGQTYYVHIRTRCTGNDSSIWAEIPFYAPVICKDPDVKFNDVNTDMAVAYWGNILSALHYEYALDNNPTAPQAGTRITKPSVLLSYLDPGTRYYFHVRSFCSDRGVLTNTDWKTFSFSTFALNIEDIENNKTLTFYPNPVTDVLVVHVNNNSKGVLTITDISGKMIKKLDIVTERSELSLSGIQAGMYLINYTSATGSETYRIVKQ